VSGRSWRIEIDGNALTLAVEHDPGRREVVVRVDGYPVARCPWNAEPALVAFKVDGSDATARITPGPDGWKHEIRLQGEVWTDAEAERPPGTASQRVRRARAPAVDGARFLSLLMRRADAVPFGLIVSVAIGLACAWSGVARALQAGLDPLTQAWGVGALTALLAPTLWTNGALDQARWLARRGEVLPGRVIALDPVRVAIALDVSWAEDGQHPAILVTHQPIDRARRGGVAVGDAVTMLIERRSSLDGVRFDDIAVVAAECLLSDPLALADLAERIDGEARDVFDAFDHWFDLAQRPLAVGIHPLAVPEPAREAEG
jgi:hypothetical protein